MELYSTYIETDKFDEVVDFYEKVFQKNGIVYNEEYNRIKQLNICKMSEIMYVNITEPYYYFNIFDPEGNTIEICSNLLK